MTLQYLITIELDETQVREDRPPEGVGVELRDEIASHLDSVASVFGLGQIIVSALKQGTPLPETEA